MVNKCNLLNYVADLCGGLGCVISPIVGLGGLDL